MNVAFTVLALIAAAASAQQRLPISADEVTLRHKIYGDERLTVLAAEPPDSDARRVRSLSTNFGRFAAAASDCEGRSLSARERVDDLPVHPDESMQFALEQAFLIAVRAEASW